MHAARREVRVIKQPFDSDDMDRTMPEDSAERGLNDHNGADPGMFSDLGESNGLEQDEGDIADEGVGHRG